MQLAKKIVGFFDKSKEVISDLIQLRTKVINYLAIFCCLVQERSLSVPTCQLLSERGVPNQPLDAFQPTQLKVKEKTETI